MFLDRGYKQKALRGIVSVATSCLILIILVVESGCDSTPADTSMLIGKWNVYAATRSGRATNTLKDAYFHFANDTLLLSNILRDEKPFSYKLQGDEVEVNGPLEATYRISHLGSDSLNLFGEIKGYNFGFYTVRDTLKIVDVNLEEPLD